MANGDASELHAAHLQIRALLSSRLLHHGSQPAFSAGPLFPPAVSGGGASGGGGGNGGTGGSGGMPGLGGMVGVHAWPFAALSVERYQFAWHGISHLQVLLPVFGHMVV